jgi:GNAT superfamily N-acetyltransferase
MQLTARRATRADIDFVTWVNIESSSPEPGFCYWDALVDPTGTQTRDFVRAVFEHDALAWGRIEDFVLLCDGDRPVAGGSGFEMSVSDYRPLRLDRMPAVSEQLGWTDAALAGVLEAYHGVWRDPQDPVLAPQAPWILECLAVVPEQRGKGVGKQLVRTLLDEGRRRGHSHAGISVTDGNIAAQRAYEASGFRMYMAYGADYFDGYYPGSTKYRVQL